jgi:2'-5' RNA ligase
MSRQRIFFGLQPPLAIRDAVHAVVRQLEREVEGRATSPATLHMTLAFLGERSSEEVSAATAVGEALRAPAFELRLDRVQRWPNRILWLGCSETPAALSALAAGLHDGLAAVGLAVSEPGFFPHVTLMRKARGPFEARSIDPVVWPVAEFALIESLRQPSGSEYRALRAWPLV